MEKMVIARCGLDCATCPAYKAQQKDDPALRAKTAKEWSAAFKADFKPEDIFCVGCAAEGKPHGGYCDACPVRLCGAEKKLANCGLCSKYPDCDKWKAICGDNPAARKLLDGIKAGKKA